MSYRHKYITESVLPTQKATPRTHAMQLILILILILMQILILIIQLYNHQVWVMHNRHKKPHPGYVQQQNWQKSESGQVVLEKSEVGILWWCMTYTVCLSQTKWNQAAQLLAHSLKSHLAYSVKSISTLFSGTDFVSWAVFTRLVDYKKFPSMSDHGVVLHTICSFTLSA